MRAQLEKTQLQDERSVAAQRFTVPYFLAPFHFHPEFELTYILQGSGKRFVGVSIDNFEAGDLILLGSNLPHYWRSDSAYYQSTSLQSEAIVVHFSLSFCDQVIQHLPECRSTIQLLTQSHHGIQFLKTQPLIDDLAKLVDLKGVRRVSALLELLDSLASHPDKRLLNSSVSSLSMKEIENDRMKRIIEYTLANFQNDITLVDAANVAHLTVTSFCRYFQKYTHKTYIAYLNEIRISHARKLLADSPLSVQEIGFVSGFQNLSNFHRLFRQQTGLSPLAFRKLGQLD
ncbi:MULTISPECIES: AraC family transcriptional regulator [unclassified Spirosoma]|uniref:AraC family transcriptional regulator n=1 Tax=unclassified Spirosoma TaxID=2621999 RepID=UPI000960ABA9|nr:MULTISPECIES: AraC family transcriptional regulator [unclassified Spirosoma]MBN8821928.1 AraC family transcriptional regulator [Spirosoma sp.]OJW80594.1 MAG: hypothetical protein BGO59_34550 [Spirosoma sp. 48-14]